MCGRGCLSRTRAVRDPAGCVRFLSRDSSRVHVCVKRRGSELSRRSRSVLLLLLLKPAEAGEGVGVDGVTPAWMRPYVLILLGGRFHGIGWSAGVASNGGVLNTRGTRRRGAGATTDGAVDPRGG